MTLIEWKEEFKTGIDEVDYEHETMIALLNELYAALSADASRDEIMDFLGEVHAGISAHFALEEKMMRDVGYDQFEDHKADHDRLLDEIRDIMDAQFAAGDDDYRETLTRGLQSWFVDHFRTRDARLHKIVGGAA